MEEVELIPAEVSLAEMKNIWSQEFVNKMQMEYLQKSTADFIDTALVLGSHNMLSDSITESLVDQLDNTSSPLHAKTSVAIINQLLAKALSGTESDCKVVLKLIIPLLEKPAFFHVVAHTFTVIEEILFTKILSKEELEAGVKKLPGIDKLYYLRDRLLLLEVGIRKLVRAAEIAGVLHVRRFSRGQEFIQRAIQKLIFTCEGGGTTLLSFHAVCTILITISEARYTWGYMSCPEVDSTLVTALDQEFGSFLAWRNKENIEPETGKFLQDIYSKAFKESDNWNPFGDEDEASQTPGAECLILERHYSAIYELGYTINRRIFTSGAKSPKYFPGKSSFGEPESDWQSDIEDIAILLQFGLRQRLSADKLRQDKEEEAGVSTNKVFENPDFQFTDWWLNTHLEQVGQVSGKRPVKKKQ